MQLSCFFFAWREDALAPLLSSSFSLWFEAGSRLIQPRDTKFCHDLLLNQLFAAGPSPPYSSHSVGCLAKRGRGNERRYDAEIWQSQSFSRLPNPGKTNNQNHSSLGPQQSGINAFCWTRRITEPPKLRRYKGFCITLLNNSPRSLCKHSCEWKLPSYFTGICNSFYSRRLFLAEIAHTKGE